jgi:transcriptional regulator with XRE-family HTH domain
MAKNTVKIFFHFLFDMWVPCGIVCGMPTLTRQDVIRIRNRAGLTQDQFSKAIGVDRGTVQDWESGKTSPTRSEGVLTKILNNQGFDLLNPMDRYKVDILKKAVEFVTVRETWIDFESLKIAMVEEFEIVRQLLARYGQIFPKAEPRRAGNGKIEIVFEDEVKTETDGGNAK